MPLSFTSMITFAYYIADLFLYFRVMECTCMHWRVNCRVTFPLDVCLPWHIHPDLVMKYANATVFVA